MIRAAQRNAAVIDMFWYASKKLEKYFAAGE